MDEYVVKVRWNKIKYGTGNYTFDSFDEVQRFVFNLHQSGFLIEIGIDHWEWIPPSGIYSIKVDKERKEKSKEK